VIPKLVNNNILSSVNSDSLEREVYCVLGIPIDAVEMPAVLQQIDAAASAMVPFLISTPNLNFLINSRKNSAFRESLVRSDLCPADGVPIIWIARLIGVPVRKRVAGSDFFEKLKSRHSAMEPLKVFLFGGGKGIAVRASESLNAEGKGLRCVGSIYPGFGTVEEMSRGDFIEAVNSSGADFLIVSLGAEKGQLWLLQNHRKLSIAVRAHLGAAVNFQAGSVQRAPQLIRRSGLEWLWRIKEEPHLWKRYWKDGCALLGLLLTAVLPLLIWRQWHRLVYDGKEKWLLVNRIEDHESITLSVSGDAVASQVKKAVQMCRDALSANKLITIDFTGTRVIDARFLGLLFLLRKRLNERGASLTLAGVSSRLRMLICLHGAGFLLAGSQTREQSA
jgi:N-acetylglucosaminyldiphosphoundecaprenol N-acetyl-beta-D-mannosaminyltransferase